MLGALLQNYKNLPIPLTKMGLIGVLVCFFFVFKEFANHVINDYNFPFSWFFITSKIVINYLLWFILAPLVYVLSKKLQIGSKTGLDYVFLFFWTVVLAIIHRAIVTKTNDLVYYLDTGYMKNFFGSNGMVGLVAGSFSSLIELLVLIALFSAVDYQKRYLKNQKDLIAAQINTLQMQLHPHFLFNTLHSISSMIDINPKKAQKMLTKIGTLLRTMLENDQEQMVTVEKELNFIKDYLDLEQIRYADKMSIHYEVSANVMQAKIPNMILQPLVENAIKYGIVPALEHGAITIEISEGVDETNPKKHLNIMIMNTSEGSENIPHPRGTGVGLKNIRKRLEGIYGKGFYFETGFTNPNHYQAEIQLPLNSLK